jgi:hypothetical protein
MSLLAIQNKWFLWKSVPALKFNGRFNRCFGELKIALKIYSFLWKVNGCYEVTGCYGK